MTSFLRPCTSWSNVLKSAGGASEEPAAEAVPSVAEAAPAAVPGEAVGAEPSPGAAGAVLAGAALPGTGLAAPASAPNAKAPASNIPPSMLHIIRDLKFIADLSVTRAAIRVCDRD